MQMTRYFSTITMSVENSHISDFFKNQTIFLTGGSGFLGKILIEKLLRQCPDLKKINVLMREKKGKSPEQRFLEIFSFECFDRLKSQNVNLLKKVSLITGDCQNAWMGLDDQQLDILKMETTCVIHAAANVKFDQSLKEAANNVKSTKYLLELAKQMPNLRVFVYVSTAYSNCLYSTINEEFYDPPMKAENLFAVVDSFEDTVLECITPILLKKWPNTYVFTKCISEDLIKDASKDLPVVVVRPAIVGSSMDEPIPGWIDNFYGVVGISVAAALGVLKTLHLKLDAKFCLVPVDYVTNFILASAWRREKSGTTNIYNFVGAKDNLLTWRTYEQKLKQFYWSSPLEKSVWYYSFNPKENKLWNDISIFFLHTVPSYIIDFILFCLGKPLFAVKNYRRLNKMLNLLAHFTSNEWIFDNNNVEALWNEMSEGDKKQFKFGMNKFDWNVYFRTATIGARLYLLKEPIDTLPKAQKKLKILFVVHYTVIALFYYLLYKVLIFVFDLF